MRIRRPLVATVACLLLGLLPAGCGAGAAETHEGEGEAEAAPTPAVSDEIPDTPVGARLSFLLEATASSQAAMTTPLGDTFTEGFFAQVSEAQLQAGLTQLAAVGPLTVRSVRELDADSLEAVLENAQGGTLLMRVTVEPEPPYRISGFGARLADYLSRNLPASWDAIAAAMHEQGALVGLFAAHLDDEGTCLPIYDEGADRPLGVGSAFKLWVLGALARAVAAGEASWDEVLPIDPAWRSISDATLRELPDGTELTLRDYANAMISVSDNSATDHLIHRLGRERVETAMMAMGAATPERNIPFLTTRAFFALKLVWSDAQRDAYFAADEETRRELVEEADAVDLGLVLWASLGWSSPRELERVEFFASNRDLCHAMAALRAMSETDAGAPVMDVLAINPGIAFDTDTWTYIGFKGGSEIGVLDGTWMVERDDGEWFVLSLTVNDPDEAVDTEAVMRLAAAGFNLLAEE